MTATTHHICANETDRLGCRMNSHIEDSGEN